MMIYEFGNSVKLVVAKQFLETKLTGEYNTNMVENFQFH